MKSILQTEKKCYITGRTDNLQSHHVFGGANRKLSEKYGLKVWLTMDMHTGDNGVHFNRTLDLELKRRAQATAMARYGWTVEDFIKIFGKNYLEE